MKKTFLTTLIALALIFTFSFTALAKPGNPNKGPGNNSGGGNPNPPGPPIEDIYNGDIYNTYNTSYNDFSSYDIAIDQSYEHNFSDYDITVNDNRAYTTVDNTFVLEALQNLSIDNLHNLASEEARITFGMSYTEKYRSQVLIPEQAAPDGVIFNHTANIFLNPIKRVVKLKPGEFCNVEIAIVADENIILTANSSNPNVKVFNKEIVVLKDKPTTIVVQAYLKPGTSWEYGFISFTNTIGKELKPKTKIVFENAEAPDWKIRSVHDTYQSSIGIGFAQNRTTWGLGGFLGVKMDRHGNETVYGVLEIDL